MVVHNVLLRLVYFSVAFIAAIVYSGIRNEEHSMKRQNKSEVWVVYDWAGNEMFNGAMFGTFDDAEEFLSVRLGNSYEEDRQEYEITLVA